MDRRVAAEVFPPGEFIKDELDTRGWTQNDLAHIIGRPPRLVSEIITGKRSVTPDTAREIGDAFGVDPQFFLNLESMYQLWRVEQTKTRNVAVSRRASLYAANVPVRELIRRRWIEPSDNIDILEARVFDFYGIKTLEELPKFWPYAARTSAHTLTLSHWAWMARAKKLARAVSASKFSDSGLAAAVEPLKALVHTPEEARHVPKILADSGVRLLVIEHIPGTKIDGACLWLDAKSPVIVLSLRYDRIDHFWHTLFHEIGHVMHKHGLIECEPFDINIFGDTSTRPDGGPEGQVDDFASDTLVPKKELDNFIARVSPLYSKEKIRGFARRMEVHPGIVVGQLQHRREIDWSHNRDMLAKIRQFVIGTALADGWGNAIPVPAA